MRTAGFDQPNDAKRLNDSDDERVRRQRSKSSHRLLQSLRAKSALVAVSMVLWLIAVSIGGVMGNGTAAGSGGLGTFGWGGDGEGYNGRGKGGGGGTGPDPVPMASPDDAPDPYAGAAVETGENTRPESGTSIADINRNPSEIGSATISRPAGRAAQGQATPGTGAGGGNEGTEFFGVRSSGQHFVYVVDNSSSMSGEPFDRAILELQNSISKLKASNKFYVIFFNSVPRCQFDDSGPPKSMIVATKKNRERLQQWVNSVGTDGGTKPEQALLWAIGMEPSAIYFLTDGGFDPQVAQNVTAANKTKKIQIHTIAFVNNAGEYLLKQIAKDNRGKYTFKP
jgi:hypothetical protein